jgi:hypothetical protein
VILAGCQTATRLLAIGRRVELALAAWSETAVAQVVSVSVIGVLAEVASSSTGTMSTGRTSSATNKRLFTNKIMHKIAELSVRNMSTRGQPR